MNCQISQHETLTVILLMLVLWFKFDKIMDSVVGDCVGIIGMYFQLKLQKIYANNLSDSYHLTVI